MIVPHGVSYGIEVPFGDGVTNLYSCPSGTKLDLFLSISPTMICLWNRSPVHLVSYHVRPDSFKEETGGYTGLHSWSSDDFRTLNVALGNGMVDSFELVVCTAQFPIGEQNKGSTFFLVYTGLAQKQQGTPHFDGLKAIIGDEDELELTEYFHPAYGKWLKLDPTVKVPKDLYCISFDPMSQVMAVIAHGSCDIYALKGESEVLLWSIPVTSDIARVQVTLDHVFVLYSDQLKVYTHTQALVFERQVCESCSSLLVLDSEIVVSGKSGLTIIPFAKQCGQSLALDYQTSTNQALMFRQDYFGQPGLQWELVDTTQRFCATSPDGKWLASYEPGLALYKRSTGKWKQEKLNDFLVESVQWLPSGFMAVLGQQRGKHSHSIRIMNSDQELSTFLHQIDLERKCIYLGVASMSDDLVVMFSDMSVHLYRVHRKSLSVVNVEFALNMSLGIVGHSTKEAPLAKWKIDLFEKSTLSSPSEVDLNVEPRLVAIENLIFMQGDSLFTVTLRTASLGDAVTATMLEPSGVETFHLKQCGQDLWLITLHNDCARLRRWPFRAEPDILLPLGFTVSGYYPSIANGIFLGVTSETGQNLSISNTQLVTPCIARFYLEQGDLSNIKCLFDSSSDKLMLMEYVILEIVEISNRLKAAKVLSFLMQSAPALASKALFIQAIIRISRKVDLVDAKWLFANSTSVEDLFSACLSMRDVSTASSLLMLRLVISGESDGLKTEDKLPILKLVELALEQENYKIIPDIRSFVRTLSTDPSDLDYIDTCVRMYAKELVKQHQWLSFMELSICWNTNDSSRLFEDCFGKMKPEEFEALLRTDMEYRVACIYAQIDVPPPTIESIRTHERRSSPTPQLRTSSVIPRSSSTISAQPAHVGMSSTSLNLIANNGTSEADRCIQFLESIESLHEEALLWRAMLYADKDAISRISTELLSGLCEFVKSTPYLTWMLSRLNQTQN